MCSCNENIDRLPFLLKSECVFCRAEKITPQRNVEFTAKQIGVGYNSVQVGYNSVQVFQISRSHLKNLGAQWMNTKQVQNSAPTNISRHRTKLCRPDGLLTEICAPLVSQSEVSIHFVHVASL
jgi:hypothetical protein